MSTAVALKTNDGVCIGVDSRCSTEDGEIKPFTIKKIFKNDPYIFAYTGSIRGGQILLPEYFTSPKNVYDLPDKIIQQCEDKYCLAHSNEAAYLMLSSYIIIDTRTKNLYEMNYDFQFNEISTYVAIGSGAYYAFGSFYTTSELNINDGHKRVELALNTAAKFDTATGGPFLIEKL